MNAFQGGLAFDWTTTLENQHNDVNASVTIKVTKVKADLIHRLFDPVTVLI